MSTKKIPERIETTCDCCGRTDEAVGFIKKAKLTFNQRSLDMHNNPAGDATISRDLCDTCAGIMTAAINEAHNKIRKG